MTSMWRRAIHYLGLGPDEDYDDYDLLGGAEPEADRRDPSQRDPAYRDQARRDEARRAPQPPRDPVGSSTVRTLSPAARAEGARAAAGRNDGTGRHGAVSTNGHSHGSNDRVARARPSAVVRPLAVPPSVKPHVVSPAAFTDAQEVADQFKRNVPVIINLQGVERDLMRRIIDFASGLCYGLSGQMERVANHVYLLTPSDVEVSPEERRRLRERGFEA